jgi:hypothetical protein
MPPVEIIPYDVLKKAKAFYDMGGTVIAWQRVPSKSATFDKTDADIQSLSTALWKTTTPSASVIPLNTNGNGGKAYFIAATDETRIAGDLRSILDNSGVKSDFEVVGGEFEDWSHYNHRVRMGMDVFMIWNGSSKARDFTARLTAKGEPELWDPTSMKITKLEYQRISENQVDVKLNMPREESVLVVFKPAGSTLR